MVDFCGLIESPLLFITNHTSLYPHKPSDRFALPILRSGSDPLAPEYVHSAVLPTSKYHLPTLP